MFSFLKKLQQDEIEQQLTVRERALRVFSKIEGLDDIKEMLLQALESPERAHTLLIGPPACAIKVSNTSFQDGYNAGFAAGRKDRINGNEFDSKRPNGHSDAYDEGYRRGYDDGWFRGEHISSNSATAASSSSSAAADGDDGHHKDSAAASSSAAAAAGGG